MHLVVRMVCYYIVNTDMLRPHVQDGMNMSSYSGYYVN